MMEDPEPTPLSPPPSIAFTGETPGGFPATLVRFGALAAADFASKGLVFITIPIIIRHFGDHAFGDIGVAGQMMTFALLLGTSGLDIYSVRTIAGSREVVGRWTTTIILLRLLLGLVAYAVLLAVAALMPQFRPLMTLVAIFGLSLFTRATYLDWAAQALQRTHTMATAMITTQAAYLALILFIVTTQWTVASVPLAQVVAEGATASWLLIWFNRNVARLERPLPFREWPQLLRHSLPFAGSQLLRGAALGLDLVLLGAFLVPSNQIGWFSGALKLFLLCGGTITVYCMILLPRLSSRFAISADAMRGELRRSMQTMLPLSAVAAVTVGAAARPLLRMVGGSAAFEQAAPSLQVLLASLVIALVNGHIRNALFAMGRQRLDLRIVAGSTAVHLVLKISMIPLLGILGVALGTLGGETALLLLGIWVLRRELSRADAVGPPPHSPATTTPGN